MHAGFIGAIIGCIIGLAGGIIGTYFSIKNTNGPKERAFMVKASVVGWIAIGIFLALLLMLPSPYRWFMWVPYVILLPVGIIFLNKRLEQIRADESTTPQSNTESTDSHNKQ